MRWSWFVVVMLFAGCPKPVSVDGDDAGVDGGSLPPCNCAVNGDGVLLVSWDCYVAAFPQRLTTPRTDCLGSSELACGLRSDKFLTPGGWAIQVFDADGTQVGAQDVSDTHQLACPDDASLKAYTLRSGAFPDAGCAVTACSCVDGGTVCP